MAAAFRSLSSLAYGSRANSSIPAPAGVVDGDVLTLVFVRGSSGGFPSAPTWPDGWSYVVPPTIVTSSGFSVSISVLKKIADGETGDNYDTTHSTDPTAAYIFATSGGSGTVVAGTAVSGITSYSVTPGITANTDGSLIAAIGHGWDFNGGQTPPAGFTERYDPSDSILYLATVGLDEGQDTGDVGVALSGGVSQSVLVEIQAADTGPSSGTADLAGSYAIKSAGHADLAGAYAIDFDVESGTADLTGSYAIKSAGHVDLAGTYAIRLGDHVDLAGEYEIDGTSGGASPAGVWAFVLPNGLTAAQTLAENHARLIRVEKFLRNKRVTDPDTGLQTIYEDDGVTVFAQGALFEDADGTQPYRGQGAERAERLA